MNEPATLLHTARTLCVALLLLVLGACASGGLRGHAPFVEINSMRLSGQELELFMGVRNPNAEPILMEHIEFSVQLEDTSLAVYKAASAVSILAHGTDILRFQLTASPKGSTLLGELEAGQQGSLAYTLQGEIRASEKIIMPFERKGRLYAVPGRPGQFR
jgi:LEA14-like dessication related protein